MNCRGIRGAVSADRNEREAILSATRGLLERIVEANQLEIDEIAAITFTATPDLDAAFPAEAARGLGWSEIPLLCTQEMAVADGLPRCVRVLVLWNTERAAEEIAHVYLGEARALRPDLERKEVPA